MQGSDRIGAGDTGDDDLTPTRITGHKMRFDKTRGDTQVGFNKSTVETDGRGSRGKTEVGVLLVIEGVVVDDAYVIQDPVVANNACQFIAFVRSMQPGRNENGNTVR